MKFRCVHNSIRFRLRKSDMEVLKSTHRIEESLSFLNCTRFTFAIQLIGKEHFVNYENNEITVGLNLTTAQEWMTSDEVSISFQVSLPNQESLSVLLEKDFPCKHTGEDFNDTYHELQPEEFRMFRQKNKT